MKVTRSKVRHCCRSMEALWVQPVLQCLDQSVLKFVMSLPWSFQNGTEVVLLGKSSSQDRPSWHGRPAAITHINGNEGTGGFAKELLASLP